MITNLFISFFNMTISATAGAILLIAGRYLTQKYIPYKYYYILWGVLFMRFCMPVSFTSIISLVGMVGDVAHKSVGGSYVVSMEYVDRRSINNLVRDYGGNNFLPVVSAIWITVASCLMLFWIFLYLKTQKSLEYAVKYNSPVIDDVRQKLNTKTKFGVFVSPNVLSPVVIGFIKPRIILPKNMENSLSRTECILAHEIIHLKRKDRYFKVAAFFICALHWYNPLVWWCYVLFNEDIENSCDREVMNFYGVEYKKHYASALITYGQRHFGLKAGYLALAQSKVARRINKILLHKELSPLQAAVFYIVTVIVGLSVTANPVLREEYTYIPKSRAVSMGERDNIKHFTDSFVADMSRGDFYRMVNKASADGEYFYPLYKNMQGNEISAKVERIFYTSPGTAVAYLETDIRSEIFARGTKRLVLEINSSPVMGGLYAESLTDYARYESANTIDVKNEAVMLRHKMIKYGLTSGENTAQNSEKITMFCMDIAFERQNSDNNSLSARDVENIAGEFFTITDFSHMENTKFYNPVTDTYTFDESMGTKYEYRIIQMETANDGRRITVEFYKDPLQLQTEKIIKYKFRKVK